MSAESGESVDGMNIRAMGKEDAVEIVAMARELARHVDDPEPRVTAADLVGDGFGPDRWCDGLVAEREGRLVGYALYCRTFEAHAVGRRLWLADLHVRPGARRAGAGRALMAALARRALDLGCGSLCWELWHLNRMGRAFYRRLDAIEESELAVMRLDAARLRALAGR